MDDMNNAVHQGTMEEGSPSDPTEGWSHEGDAAYSHEKEAHHPAFDGMVAGNHEEGEKEGDTLYYYRDYYNYHDDADAHHHHREGEDEEIHNSWEEEDEEWEWKKEEEPFWQEVHEKHPHERYEDEVFFAGQEFPHDPTHLAEEAWQTQQGSKSFLEEESKGKKGGKSDRPDGRKKGGPGRPGERFLDSSSRGEKKEELLSPPTPFLTEFLENDSESDPAMVARFARCASRTYDKLVSRKGMGKGIVVGKGKKKIVTQEEASFFPSANTGVDLLPPHEAVPAPAEEVAMKTADTEDPVAAYSYRVAHATAHRVAGLSRAVMHRMREVLGQNGGEWLAALDDYFVVPNEQESEEEVENFESAESSGSTWQGAANADRWREAGTNLSVFYTNETKGEEEGEFFPPGNTNEYPLENTNGHSSDPADTSYFDPGNTLDTVNETTFGEENFFENNTVTVPLDTTVEPPYYPGDTVDTYSFLADTNGDNYPIGNSYFDGNDSSTGTTMEMRRLNTAYGENTTTDHHTVGNTKYYPGNNTVEANGTELDMHPLDTTHYYDAEIDTTAAHTADTSYHYDPESSTSTNSPSGDTTVINNTTSVWGNDTYSREDVPYPGMPNTGAGWEAEMQAEFWEENGDTHEDEDDVEHGWDGEEWMGGTEVEEEWGAESGIGPGWSTGWKLRLLTHELVHRCERNAAKQRVRHRASLRMALLRSPPFATPLQEGEEEEEHNGGSDDTTTLTLADDPEFALAFCEGVVSALAPVPASKERRFLQQQQQPFTADGGLRNEGASEGEGGEEEEFPLVDPDAPGLSLEDCHVESVVAEEVIRAARRRALAAAIRRNLDAHMEIDLDVEYEIALEDPTRAAAIHEPSFADRLRDGVARSVEKRETIAGMDTQRWSVNQVRVDSQEAEGVRVESLPGGSEKEAGAGAPSAGDKEGGKGGRGRTGDDLMLAGAVILGLLLLLSLLIRGCRRALCGGTGGAGGGVGSKAPQGTSIPKRKAPALTAAERFPATRSTPRRGAPPASAHALETPETEPPAARNHSTRYYYINNYGGNEERREARGGDLELGTGGVCAQQAPRYPPLAAVQSVVPHQQQQFVYQPQQPANNPQAAYYHPTAPAPGIVIV